ncbi:hypothetical protein GCM10027289_27800 [Tsukamurella serpentis]
MSAEAVLAVAVIAVGLLVVCVLSAGMAVLQRRVDALDSRSRSAVEEGCGGDVAALADERHPE